MRKLIWRPRAVSRRALVLIAVFAMGGLVLAERVIVPETRPLYDQKIAASRLAKEAMEVIKNERVRRGYPINPGFDPLKTGLIGLAVSDVTSIAGNLAAKQASINPNFAAVVVDMLGELGVKEGDQVAVGVSGSFPALNICTFAALETLKVTPIVIASASASQYGANFPDLLWVDMENVLFKEGLFSFRSKGASLGGVQDIGVGMSKTSRRQVREGIERNQLEFLSDETFESSIVTRMQKYSDYADGMPIRGFAAYVNVGGGTVSVGKHLGKRLFNPGINRRMPAGAGLVDGVMPRFAKEGVPVVHLVQILELTDRYLAVRGPSEDEVSDETQATIPISAPQRIPPIGEGDVYEGWEYSRPLVSGILALLVGSLFAFIRSDVGFRLLKGGGKQKDQGHPEPMV